MGPVKPISSLLRLSLTIPPMGERWRPSQSQNGPKAAVPRISFTGSLSP